MLTDMGKRRPTDPNEIMQRRAERLANEAEISRLRGQGVVVKLDRARRIVSAYRRSPFVKLRDNRTITDTQALAAEKLTDDWAIWRGLDGRAERIGTPIDSSTFAEVVTDRMLRAGERVSRVLALIGPLDRDLLIGLIEPLVERDRPPAWRDVVRDVTGVTQTVRQSQMIVAALGNLARAYGLCEARR